MAALGRDSGLAAPGQCGSQQECDRQAGQRSLPGRCSKPRQRLPRPLRGLDCRSQPVDGDPQAFGHLLDRPRNFAGRVNGPVCDARRGDGLRCLVVQGQNSNRGAQGSHLWLSPRARVLNSGPEDLWLSATGAVCERRVAASIRKCRTMNFVPTIHTSLDAPALRRIVAGSDRLTKERS